MSLASHQIELLSPARDIQIGKEAILHGADAVYIGGPGFGARHNAANSVQDISELVKFAHRYHAKIFVTLNTIFHDDELEGAERLIHQLYDAGVDALIVQDMGVLEMDIPPIELHASTQTDIRTLEKAQFLDQVGFSQLVLARELNLEEIHHISQNVSAPIEFFIHGALCVAFSGQCYISHAQTGRSANRGDCSQACRLPYTLKDDEGRVVAYDKHLLSMKDNNQTANLIQLVDAGVRSFKIEGRYKDMAYVKNITAHYRQELDAILAERPDLAPASSGRTEHFFTPNPDKTFHRGSTDYFVTDRKIDIGAFDTPKFIGLPVGELLQVAPKHIVVQTHTPLTNGDGLNIMHKRDVVGFRANTVTTLATFEQEEKTFWQYRVELSDAPEALAKAILPQPLNRNLDHDWQQALTKTSSERRLPLSFFIDANVEHIKVTATSEEGATVNASLAGPFEQAHQPLLHVEDAWRTLFSQLGNTIYFAEHIEISGNTGLFISPSQLKGLRRELIDQLEAKRAQLRPISKRKLASTPAPIYPEEHLTFLANVYNHKAREFYHRHGVQLIDAAYEAHEEDGDVPVMITKHCLRFAFNLCPKQAKGVTGVRTKVKPMQLIHQGETLTLKFDCKPCEMHVVGKIKGNILQSTQLGSFSATVGHYDPSTAQEQPVKWK